MSLSGVTTRSMAKQLQKDTNETALIVETKVDTTNQFRVSTKSKTLSSSSRLTKTCSRRTNNSATTKANLKSAKVKKAVLLAPINAQVEIHKIQSQQLIDRTKFEREELRRTNLI